MSTVESPVSLEISETGRMRTQSPQPGLAQCGPTRKGVSDRGRCRGLDKRADDLSRLWGRT